MTCGDIDARAVWKYWHDNRSGGEYAFDLARDPAENANSIDGVPSATKREWRRHVLAVGLVGARLRADDAVLEHGYPLKSRPGD